MSHKCSVDSQIEAILRKLIPKLIKELNASIHRLPCITFESRQEGNAKAVEQITAWLFRVSENARD